IKLVEIVGAGRSGSTLLDILLGGFDDAIAVGELRFIWTRGVLYDQLCGCSSSLTQCDFWKKVFADLQLPDLQAAAEQRAHVAATVDRLRYFSKYLASGSRGQLPKEVKQYAEDEWALVQSIARVSGRSIIVDSSKYPGRALAFAMHPEIRQHLYVIHLARDARAVAHSWTRRKRRTEINTHVEYMPRHGVASSSGLWMALNYASQKLRKQVVDGRYRFLRYEDLTASPERYIGELAQWLGVKDSVEQVINHASVDEIHHTVSGNPLRFEGIGEVRPDLRWQREMSGFSQLTATLIAWPLLRRYRYFSRQDKRS
ncbi:MAG: hypothetical protein HKM24_06135, partial [Gammaproteobacteria bacterium]|nr:hypothetical protein [Gammaproteobacteria bacterium]